MTRALVGLEAAIGNARGPVERACLMAERAGLLARLGHADQATEALGDLREQQAQLVHPALSAWLALAEGMLAHERQQHAAARDRIRRAHALSVAARERPLIAISAAWLAETESNGGEAAAMARHVAESLQEADAEHHAARARASLVAAQAYHWSARLDLATPWYQRAREHAAADGDDATLSALMTARACICGAQVRRAAIVGGELGQADPAAVREALLAAEASRNFDSHLGRHASHPAVMLIHAQLVMVQGDAAGALAGLEALLSAADTQGPAFGASALHADMAWGTLQLGHPDEALAAAHTAEQRLCDDDKEDERAAAHGRLAQVFAALDKPRDAARHHEQAQAQLAALAVRQQRTIDVLDDALRQVPGL